MERFRNSIGKMWSVWTKIVHIERIFREEIFAYTFVFICIYPLSKFGSYQTNSRGVLALYSVCFKWKNWFEQTALNMSIRRVTLTSSQNVKPPFLYQYLISFNDFFFILDISLRSTLKPKKISDLKVYSNLSQPLHKFSREKIALISISFNPLLLSYLIVEQKHNICHQTRWPAIHWYNS